MASSITRLEIFRKVLVGLENENHKAFTFHSRRTVILTPVGAP